MRAALRQTGGDGQLVCRDFTCQNRLAAGQGAGLVEHDIIDLGQPFDGSSVLDQDTRPKQPADSRRHDGRHGKAQRTGTGDDQHRDRDIQRMAHVAAEPIPSDKCGEGQKMHDGRIDFRSPLGQTGILRLRGFSEADKLPDASQNAVFYGFCDPYLQRSGQVAGSGEDVGPDVGPFGQALSGQQCLVDVAVTFHHGAVDGDAHARLHKDHVADAQILDRHMLVAVTDAERGFRLHRRKLDSGGARRHAGAVVQITPQQQKERQA